MSELQSDDTVASNISGSSLTDISLNVSESQTEEPSLVRPVSTVSIPGNLSSLYEDDTSNNVLSLSAYLRSLTIGAQENETKSSGGHGHGVR